MRVRVCVCACARVCVFVFVCTVLLPASHAPGRRAAGSAAACSWHTLGRATGSAGDCREDHRTVSRPPNGSHGLGERDGARGLRYVPESGRFPEKRVVWTQGVSYFGGALR